MPDDIVLEKEQMELFSLLVETARRVPRDKRGKFLLVENSEGGTVIHPGLTNWNLNAYKGDIEILAQEDLISLSHTSRGSLQFDVTPRGFKYYDQLKQTGKHPITKIEANSSKAALLDQSSIEILEDILKKTRSTGEGVDAVHYRAQHGEQLDLLDELERTGFLRRYADKYWVSLFGLSLLDDAESKVIMENCEKTFSVLKDHYKSQPKDQLMVVDLARLSQLSYKQAAECLGYMVEVSLGGHTTSFMDPDKAFIQPSEMILRYRNFQGIIAEVIRLRTQREAQSAQYVPGLFSSALPQKSFNDQQSNKYSGVNQDEEKIPDVKDTFPNADNVWRDIEEEYEINKRAFGRKIYFVDDDFKRKVLFRDIEHAYILANAGFAKPAAILAGSVIEELLRLFLKFKRITPAKDNFDGYIKTCADKGFLKTAVHQLSDSFRHFRNLVHLSKETSSRHTISKATAKGAVASIFMVVNDLEGGEKGKGYFSAQS